eukprot:5188636-Amphidinium_carterae.1
MGAKPNLRIHRLTMESKSEVLCQSRAWKDAQELLLLPTGVTQVYALLKRRESRWLLRRAVSSALSATKNTSTPHACTAQ